MTRLCVCFFHFHYFFLLIEVVLVVWSHFLPFWMKPQLPSAARVRQTDAKDSSLKSDDDDGDQRSACSSAAAANAQTQESENYFIGSKATASARHGLV